jgi:hypothetical protein
MAGSGERAGERGRKDHHAPPLPAPLLHFAEERELISVLHLSGSDGTFLELSNFASLPAEPEGFPIDSPNANERDPRSVAELAFGEASSGGAEFCAPAFLKISYAGQSLDRLAHGAARKKSVASIARLTSPTCWPPIVPKQPHSMFNPRARADTNSQRQSVQWVGRRCRAAGYVGRASAFALLQRDKATRPYRLGNVPIIIGKWYETIAGRGEGFSAPRESEQES